MSPVTFMLEGPKGDHEGAKKMAEIMEQQRPVSAYAGVVDQVEVFDRILTAEEMQRRYQEGENANTSDT